ncbi:hypothetical protein CW304_23230 [Bacillus sp. UFRGS-B20]|nr:hypothetical protein CW304_23230 [Bacillus sp. UFRGS-B20]
MFVQFSKNYLVALRDFLMLTSSFSMSTKFFQFLFCRFSAFPHQRRLLNIMQYIHGQYFL